jgi:hypothetical protein
MTEENAEKKQNYLFRWLNKHQIAVYLVISTLGFGFQWMRQSDIERKLADSERNAVHKAETAYSVGLSGLLQTATILEGNLVEMKQQNLLLIKCVREKNCDKSPDLLTTKEQKQYVPVATHYFKIQQQMIEESKEER